MPAARTSGYGSGPPPPTHYVYTQPLLPPTRPSNPPRHPVDGVTSPPCTTRHAAGATPHRTTLRHAAPHGTAGRCCCSAQPDARGGSTQGRRRGGGAPRPRRGQPGTARQHAVAAAARGADGRAHAALPGAHARHPRCPQREPCGGAMREGAWGRGAAWGGSGAGAGAAGGVWGEGGGGGAEGGGKPEAACQCAVVCRLRLPPSRPAGG